jgi:hypothetical protein
MMKRLFKISMLTLFVLTLATQAQAQEDKSKRPSPPAVAEGVIGDATIQINYSSPAVKGRKIWGEMEKYGKIWRAGANEATTIEISSDVKVEGQNLPAGRYAFFAIPNPDKWTLIFNSEPDQWGAYRYNQEKDALRVDVTPGATKELVERLKYEVQSTNDNSGVVSLLWENIKVSFTVSK